MGFWFGKLCVQVLHLPVKCKLCTLLFGSKLVCANFSTTTIMQIMHITFVNLKHRDILHVNQDDHVCKFCTCGKTCKRYQIFSLNYISSTHLFNTKTRKAIKESYFQKRIQCHRQQYRNPVFQRFACHLCSVHPLLP